MKSSVVIDWEKKEGGITGSHEKVKFVEQAPLEASWASENMVVLWEYGWASENMVVLLFGFF